MGLESPYHIKAHSKNLTRPSPTFSKFGFLGAILSVLNGCGEPGYEVPVDYGTPSTDENNSGEHSRWTLPFPSGNYWKVTQGYETGTHVDWGGEYGDDTYALDFSRSACDAYGMAINPVDKGVVLEVIEEEGGYGESLLIEHEEGYVSRYAHLLEVRVSVGEIVDINTNIAYVGNSGEVSGEACTEHPGTHLHVALYLNGEGARPEPLSGNTPINVGCWYNREGIENCSGDPGDY